MMRQLIAPAVLLVVSAVVAAQGTPQQTAAKPGGAAQAQQPANAQTTPKIDIANKIQDFGTVPKGEKITAVFEVKNSGTAPLEITQVRPTCGCTVADYDRTIQPGGTGKIEARVDTTAFSGPISKAVLVYSSDPTTPQVNLVIKADVRSYIEVRPRPILRFNALQGEPATDKVTLVSADGSAFKVTGVDTGGGPYQVSYHELTGDDRLPNEKGSQWEVEVTIPANAKEGMINQKIELKTTSPKAAAVPLTLTGIVRPIIQVIPAEVNFGTVPGDAPVGRNLLVLSNRQGAQLEIKSAEVDSPDFKTELVPLEAGQRFQIAVSIPAGLSKGEHKTNDPTRGSIEVPVQAIVR
jgi:hypothetical protein